MSGGSFNHLYSKDVERIVAEGMPDLENMHKRLGELGYAEDVTEETRALIRSVYQFFLDLETAAERLRPVWKAVEWWVSADSRESAVKDALTAYRGASK